MHRHWFGMSDEGYLNMDVQMGFSYVIYFMLLIMMDDQTD
jgi:hypothetical protein